jgi:hypothetical protein
MTNPKPRRLNPHVSCAYTLVSPARYIDARTQYGLTPLHYAVKGQALQAASVLLQRGANSNLSALHDGEMNFCPPGTTPLHIAARQGDKDMIHLLLQQYVSTHMTAERRSLIVPHLTGWSISSL